MLRFLLGLLAVCAGFATVLTGIDVATIETRSEVTVFQQMAARFTFGFAFLTTVTAIGLFVVSSSIHARSRRVETVLKDIALSNADMANATKSLLLIELRRAERDGIATNDIPVANDASGAEKPGAFSKLFSR